MTTRLQGTENCPQVPAHIDAYRHPELGKPSRKWPYYVKKRLVGYVCRFDGTNGKTFRPLVLKGSRWQAKGIPAPRPLFNLPEILSQSDRPILVCEGRRRPRPRPSCSPT